MFGDWLHPTVYLHSVVSNHNRIASNANTTFNIVIAFVSRMNRKWKYIGLAQYNLTPLRLIAIRGFTDKLIVRPLRLEFWSVDDCIAGRKIKDNDISPFNRCCEPAYVRQLYQRAVRFFTCSRNVVMNKWN